jgi:mRNA interferase MazF
MGSASGQSSLVTRSCIPDAGDLIWLTFDLQAGHEQAGTARPWSFDALHTVRKPSLTLVCPISRRVKG